MQAVGALLNGMAMVMPMVGAHTPLGLAIAKALADIGKHIPEGAVSPAGEKNAIEGMMQRQQQMAPQMAALRSQQAGGAPAGGGAPPPAAAAA